MVTDETINSLIDDSINALVKDSPRIAAEALEELADVWAKSGLGQSSFENVRHYIINEATEKSDVLFIKEKLTAAEQRQRHLRYERDSGTESQHQGQAAQD